MEKLILEFPQFDEKYIYKFYIARKKNYNDTFKMLEKHLEWKKTCFDHYHFDKIQHLSSDCLKLCKYVGYGFVDNKHDFRHFFLFDSRYFLVNQYKSNEDLVNHVIYIMKTIKDITDDHVTIFFDVSKFSYTNFKTVRLLESLTNELQNNYPETIHKAFIIKAPIAFRLAWKVIRPWLDQESVKKIDFVSEQPKILLQ